MKAFASFVLASLMMMSAPFAAGAEPDPASVAKLFAAWDKPDAPGLSLAVIRGGKVVFQTVTVNPAKK